MKDKYLKTVEKRKEQEKAQFLHDLKISPNPVPAAAGSSQGNKDASSLLFSAPATTSGGLGFDLMWGSKGDSDTSSEEEEEVLNDDEDDGGSCCKLQLHNLCCMP